MPQNSFRTFNPVTVGAKSPPSHVRLGLLTRRLINGARWQGIDAFPAWQVWADDIELVLEFLALEGRLSAFLETIKSAWTKQHRDAYLAEARALFYLCRKGFRVVEWEPLGQGSTRGEAKVSLAGAPNVFIEVKQPGWQGELMPRLALERKALSPKSRELRLDRMKQEKYINMQGGAVSPHIKSMDVVRRNALPKLTDLCPNLAIVVDDLTVTPVGLPGLADFVAREFLKPNRDLGDLDDTYTYERLGGVVFLLPEAKDSHVDYRVDFVENQGALPACVLPECVSSLLSHLRDESSKQRKRLCSDCPSLFEIVQRTRIALD